MQTKLHKQLVSALRKKWVICFLRPVVCCVEAQMIFFCDAVGRVSQSL